MEMKEELLKKIRALVEGEKLALAVLNTEDNLTNFGLVAAGGVISVIPITLFVIFAQNYLISGLSSGAVKE